MQKRVGIFTMWEHSACIAGDKVTVFADKSRLSQVMNNLVSNAVKFTPKGGRITLSGHMRLTESPTAKPRFLARHPTAHRYADLPDFATYTFEVRSGHYIGGFGRIVDLPSEALLSSADPAPELAAAEADIINHMNTDHADAIALYATEIAKCAPGTWRMCGIDSSGFDLLDGSSAARIDFPEHVRTPNEARVALVALVKQARAGNATNSHGLP